MKANYPATLRWKNFIHLSEEQRREVLRWRNHPEVRKWMRTPSEISTEAHRKFLESLQRSSDKQYFLLSLGETDIGVVDFYNISESEKTCFYGYYLNPNYLGASYGILLEYWVAEYAFSELQLKSIRAETKPENRAANELHEYFGFSPENGLNADLLQEAILSRRGWIQKRLELQPILFRMFEA